ncbi:alpha/beta fold hydrolase [Blastococcus sp. SYSU DS0619]
MSTMVATRRLDTPEASLVYDVRGPLPTADGRPPLFLIGAPMDASGFCTLAGHLADRTVITYDPRGLGRSTRTDGRTTHTPQQHADDVHRIIEVVGGPVDMFASSGGAVTALALVAAHPDDVTTLVAHEPPLLHGLPDAARAIAATRAVQAVYEAKGWGHGMAAFIALTSWQGEFTDDFSATAADPAAFGLPAVDDGSRSDPLLSHDSDAIATFRPDVPALTAAPTRIVVAAGIESKDALTWRTAVSTAQALGQEITVFPSDHGGFLGGEFGQHGQPEAFAERLREVLDAR